MSDRQSIRELVHTLRVAEYALEITTREYYVDASHYYSTLFLRKRAVANLRAQLWERTHKSKYVIKPSEEL